MTGYEVGFKVHDDSLWVFIHVLLFAMIVFYLLQMLKLTLLLLALYEVLTDGKTERTIETWSYQPLLNSLSRGFNKANLRLT